MSQNRWTTEQLQAIQGRGGSILVSAAAGSGKTAVLVERVIGMLTRGEDPVDADRLLVVTFSNAAAREMKQRISRRLWELSREAPGDLRLARQQLLARGSAPVGRLHSRTVELVSAAAQARAYRLVAPLLSPEDESLRRLVKAADKLSAYIKCLEELEAGNNEFADAAGETLEALRAMELPEAAWFLDHFSEAFGLTLDGLQRM